MNRVGIFGASRTRSAAGGAREKPPARLAVVGRRHANPVGQCGRRRSARRARQRRTFGKNLWSRRTASPPGGAAREPVARQRRDPDGTVARLWRGARHAHDVRLLAARILRRQPRRARRRHPNAKPRDAAKRTRKDRAAAGGRAYHAAADAAPPPTSLPEPPVPTGEAPAAFALFDALAEDDAEDTAPAASTTPEEPDLQSVLQLDLPHVEVPPPSAESRRLRTQNHRHQRKKRRRPRMCRVTRCASSGRPTSTAASSLGAGEFRELIGSPTRRSPGADVAGDRAGSRARSARPDRTGARNARDLGRHRAGLAGRWRPCAGGIVGIAGVRPRSQFSGLPRIRHLPRSRSPDAAGRASAARFAGTPPAPQPLSADIIQAGPAGDLAPVDQDAAASAPVELQEPVLPENSPQTDLDTIVETPNQPSAEILAEPPKNVLPFRPIGEAKPPVLTPVENSAFNELARQLSARLDSDNGAAAPEVTETVAAAETTATVAEPRKRSLPSRRRSRNAGMAGAAGAAGARNCKTRQGAARSHSHRHPDLSPRPAALCQSGLPQAHRLREPACAGRSRRARCALCRAGRLHRQLYVGSRHAGDDFRKPRRARTMCRRKRPTRASIRFRGTMIPRSP